MVSLSGFLLAFLLLLSGSWGQENRPKLILIQSIFRHGARYPEHVINKGTIGDGFVEQQQLNGQLTDEGRSMHYVLGQKLHQTYWKPLFGGTPYEHNYNQSRFYIKSTDVNRTIESVQSQLYGIFEALPPLSITPTEAKFSVPAYPGIHVEPGYAFGQEGKKYHPVAVQVETPTSNPYEIGDFLFAFDKEYCPNQRDWIDANNKSPKAAQINSTPQFLRAMKELSLALGLDQNTINSANFYNYYDNLVCLQYLGLKVPEIMVKPSETKRALDAIYAINANIVFTLNNTQVRTTATPFFTETLTNFHRIMREGAAAPQWVIYSAHDATLTILLAAMKYWSAECIYNNFLYNMTSSDQCISTFPKFATIMVFELYKYESHNRADPSIFYSSIRSAASAALYTFKVNYNGQHLRIPFCGNLYECQVEAYEEWMSTWIVDDFAQACGVNKTYAQQLKFMAIGGALSTIISVIWHFILSRKWKEMFKSKGRGVMEYVGLVDQKYTKQE